MKVKRKPRKGKVVMQDFLCQLKQEGKAISKIQAFHNSLQNNIVQCTILVEHVYITDIIFLKKLPNGQFSQR